MYAPESIRFESNLCQPMVWHYITKQLMVGDFTCLRAPFVPEANVTLRVALQRYLYDVEREI